MHIDLLIDLSPFERVVVGVLTVLSLVTGSILLFRANERVLVETPRDGGVYIEGITGTPRFINPLLAISEADRDLTKLVYAGLMARDRDGNLIPELAESYPAVSDDGLTYTFTLRSNITFHDGTPLTAEDVVYTIEQAANAELLSPVFANWENAVVEAVDERTVKFTLPESYVPFLENTTLGILPRHIWEGVNADQYRFSQFNITPVGSGPYRVTEVIRDKSGIPASYELLAFDAYVLGTPHITAMQFRLFDSRIEALEAFKTGDVHAVGGVPYADVAELLQTLGQNTFAIRRIPLLRTFAVFMNHNRQPLLLRKEVREALAIATPKEAIVGEVLHGYGTTLSGPLPPHLLQTSSTTTADSATEITETLEGVDVVREAQSILENAGWEKNAETGIYEREIDKETKPLSISMAVLNLPELTATAERIVESWRAVGIQVEVNTYEPTDLVQSVVRPRRYDTLLYGMVLGHEMDLYAFWHSSQRNDPGLNIAQYADIEADALLEKMRTERDPVKRQEYYASFATLVSEKNAAIFLYMPDYVSVISEDVHGVGLHPIAEPYERFDMVHEWYIDTDRVWPFVRAFLHD
jgi:peptide/nickel transport system substrate-binding protein